MRWCEIFKGDRVLPNNEPVDPEAEAIAKGLQEAKRRGIRLPGEPSSEWGKVTPQQIIQCAREIDTEPSIDTVIVPAGSSVAEIVALLLRNPNAG